MQEKFENILRDCKQIPIKYLFSTLKINILIRKEPRVWRGARLWIYHIPILRDAIYAQVEALPVRLADEPAICLECFEQAEHEYGIN